MEIKNIWTNYKIYAFLLGIITGTIVYNLLGMDFSFVMIEKIGGTRFLDAFLYFLMINLRFWIIIFLLSFLKVKSKIILAIIFVESFLLAGFITITILSKSYVVLYEIPLVIFKIISALFMYNGNKIIIYRIISMLIMIAGTILETIIFVNF